MIATVTNIIEKPGKQGTYLNVTIDCQGHKTSFNVFDKVDQTTFRQAYDQKRTVDEAVVKNEKGYDTPESVKFADANNAPVAATPPVGAKEDTKPPATFIPPARTNIETMAEERNRSMALSYAKDLAVAGKIETNQIIITANLFLTYISTGKI